VSPSSRARANRTDLVLLNDRLVPGREATISALDRGFLYGDGLFETLRTYAGEPFGLADHLARLRRSAGVFHMTVPTEPTYWAPRIRRLLRATGLVTTDAAVRLTMSRGTAPFGIVPPLGIKPTTLLLATPLDPRLPRAQAEGVRVCFFPFRVVTARLAGHKTLHYLPAVLGKMVARRRGAWEALYLGADDTVLEGTTSNVFVVDRGTIVTPPLHGVLAGVTRKVIATVARRAGIRLVERAFDRRALLRADEVFLTASTIEVLPVVRVESRRIGDGRPGPITRTLQQAYTAHVARALARKQR
jgi:branched-chain amino acid aminotransferase